MIKPTRRGPPAPAVFAGCPPTPRRQSCWEVLHINKHLVRNIFPGSQNSDMLGNVEIVVSKPDLNQAFTFTPAHQVGTNPHQFLKHHPPSQDGRAGLEPA